MSKTKNHNTMKEQILFRGQRVDTKELVEGNFLNLKGRHFIVSPFDSEDNVKPIGIYAHTLQRLIHDENEARYYTGDTIAIYSEMFTTFEEAQAEGFACVSEIDENGLVMLEHEEFSLLVSNLTMSCHKFYHITREEYETFCAN